MKNTTYTHILERCQHVVRICGIPYMRAYLQCAANDNKRTKNNNPSNPGKHILYIMQIIKCIQIQIITNIYIQIIIVIFDILYGDNPFAEEKIMNTILIEKVQPIDGLLGFFVFFLVDIFLKRFWFLYLNCIPFNGDNISIVGTSTWTVLLKVFN